MPSAHEYHDAATRLRSIARQLADESALLCPATDPSMFAGGPLATILDRALDAHVRHVARAGEELERLAVVALMGGLGVPPPVPLAWWAG